VEARLFGNLDETGRACNVDFGEIVANDVEADHQQAPAGETFSHAPGDLAIALGERLGNSTTARGQIAARFTGERDSGERKWNRFAPDQQDALVAIDDFGNVALGHDGARAVVGEHFENAASIVLLRLEHKNARATHTVERLDHDLA